eukprot:gb/GECG01006074.1/.p1 GENE.gb/GECG01006074.1/~~gb/GECG01006074.1/.p1  ORF type:complete len:196 (+),score=11.19 gb/GECG01006074.1/:1-588(+)
MLSTALRNAASVRRIGSFIRPRRAWTALSTYHNTWCMHNPSWTSASLGMNYGGWFIRGIQPRAEVSTEARSETFDQRGDLLIYYDEESVRNLRSKLETLIDSRRKAVKKYQENGTPYQFREPNITKNYGESTTRWMIINGRFVDKTAAYTRALDTDFNEGVRTRVASWARRLGKTTWLLFFKRQHWRAFIDGSRG